MLEPGQIFATRYRVERCIAEGGMGAIFEAVHTATERRVALKLLYPHIMSVASARKKFELEAKISARVNSPFIVEVLDAGFDEGTKSPFLVMELLEGHTLAAFVRARGPLTVDEALPLLEQLAAGLDAAHKYKEGGALKPIVHRDLKPENLFLSREDDGVVLKILDFGIAKVLGESCNVSQEVRGTPLYMAFEQVTAGPLSPQTDVWALGLIAYFTLTGLSYWRSASEQSANVQSLFAEILNLPLIAPSRRLSQQGSSVSLPPAFDTWMLTCLERDPARRHVSAGAAIEALARALGRTPRPRARFSSMPAPALALADAAPETAPEPTPLPGVSVPPTPAPPPVAFVRAASAPTAIAAPAAAAASARKPVVEPSTTGSLPAVASERSSAPAHGRAPSSVRRRAAGAAAAGAVLVAALVWIGAGGRASDAGAAAAAHEAVDDHAPPASTARPAPADPAPRDEPRATARDDGASTSRSTPPEAHAGTEADGPPEPHPHVEATSPTLDPASAPPTAFPGAEPPGPEPRVRVASPEEIEASQASESPAVMPAAPVAPVSAVAPVAPTAAAAAPEAPAPTDPPRVVPERPAPNVVVAPVAAVAPASAPNAGDKPAGSEKPATPRRKYDSKDAYNTR